MTYGREIQAGCPVSKMGSTYEVNNAAIICGDLHTANATVYIINRVLMPMH